MDATSRRTARDKWLTTTMGEYASLAMANVAPFLASDWSRRQSTVLVSGTGYENLAYQLWESGFDITVQDTSEHFIKVARAHLSHRAEYMLCANDFLSCEDDSFDYTVALGTLECSDNHQKLLAEMQRVTTKGIVIIFANALSLHNATRYLYSLDKHLSQKATFAPVAIQPFSLYQRIKKEFNTKNITWCSLLAGPTWTWKNSLFRHINFVPWRIPVGAVCGVRIDLGSFRTGSGLPISVKEVKSNCC